MFLNSNPMAMHHPWTTHANQANQRWMLWLW